MIVQEVIALLQKQGTWLNFDYQTRDRLLWGENTHEVTRIGICWVATMEAIQKAMDLKIDFIITHENPFYETSTQPHVIADQMAHQKQALLTKHHIAVYRCHDVWDCIAEVGVADSWAKRLGFDFDPRPLSSYIQYATITKRKASELAQHVANSLAKDGEGAVNVFGPIDKMIERIAIGTGAATDIFKMLLQPVDALIVSDDGMNNYVEAQLAIDMNFSLIVVHHSSSEIAGLKAMVPWLQTQLKLVDIHYLEEGYTIHGFIAKR